MRVADAMRGALGAPTAWLYLSLSCLACRGDAHAARGAQAPGTHAVAFVSNEDSGDISIIDLQTRSVLQTIAVGKRPRGLRLSPDGKKLYVAVSGSPKATPGTDESTLPPPDRSADGIAEIDLASARLVRTIPSGTDPESFDLSPDGRFAYVSNEDSAKTSIVDLARGQVVHSVEVGGEPEGVTTCPDGKCVYVTSEQDGTVHVLDSRSRRVQAVVPVGKRPRTVLFDRDGTRAFVSNELSSSITIVDTASHAALSTITVDRPRALVMGLALSPDDATLYASTGRGGEVAVIDVSTASVKATVSGVGTRPWGIAVSPDGRQLYTANGPSNDVSVVDLREHKVVKRIPVGRSPWTVLIGTPSQLPVAAAVRSRPPDELEKLSEDAGQWVMAARNYQNTRFSSLADIHAGNVAKLRVAWGYATGISKGHEAAPLVVGSTMYLVTPFPNRLIALDLTVKPARVKWLYDPEPDRAAQGVACCDVVNRGAAYADGKIVYNTLDNHTIALDAASGRELWKTKLGDIAKGESMTMAPLIVRDKVLVGNSGGEFGARGWLSALELDSGALAWRAYATGPDRDVLIGPSFRPFYASDRGVDLGVRSWPPGKWQQGGGTSWGFVSYDPVLDLIYYGTANPGPWNPEQRPGDNKWTSGVFARRPDTGEAVWFYQWSPHDEHDYDGVNENIIADLPLGGTTRQVILNVNRTGYVYVLDRARGEVLSATPFVHVTSSHGVDLKTGRLQVAGERSIGPGRITRNICPASPGGKDWQPAAYSAETHTLFIPANNLCQDTQGYETSYIAGTPYVGTHTRMYAGPGGHRGELIAWDVIGQKARYRIREEFPVWSGVLATSGKLVFYGTMDGWFKAIHADTGKELWKERLGSGIIGQPVTFRGPDGRQYVSVFAGVGGWSGAVVSGDLDPRDTTAALGFVGAMADLSKHVNKGGTLYTFEVAP
jgi:PQQ-dependent dehydrogenase (methanol/ethanol family)/PQQ-dependent catabolism-associated beta-propeller protein